MSRIDGEPSEWEHGAPWNADDSGGCNCLHCRKLEKQRQYEEEYDE